MNRTDRLYALIEELRAISPRCRSARELGERLQVGVRTVERDIEALREAGVPVRAEDGGYALGEPVTPSPLALTADEALAVAVALSRAGRRPLASGARSALRKLMDALPDDAARCGEPAGPAARAALAEFGEPPHADASPGAETGEAASATAAGDERWERRRAVAQVIDEALLHRRVLRITYDAKSGEVTERDVEPGVFIGGRGGFWYLVGWCRLRQDVRVFRLDRIAAAALTDEQARSRRPLEEYAPHIPELMAQDRPG
ncbi:transcriptional regulator [Sphaerisporangium melleum]|uniref:Transcriptional regulator n=1 Tax=Sphaerisporangium melleum TaxID=321316 RepID=A0A917R1V2_9ACTN|nr:WYL domain-containing protein [Sphaerisporangium melleum]GGK82426.1 transcriptional regulator [Sphaerisporangium melleum]GII71338.1 transcriptional regulator [Sphaerisporangium melleum]